MHEKIRLVNINNPKANTGAVLLKLNKCWEQDLPDQCAHILQIIQIAFTRQTNASPAGTANLTDVAMKIGNYIHRVLDREPGIPQDVIRVGCLFIEAFYATKYIDLY